MGPIELLFLTVVALFGAIGIVRSYQRELGVTTLLLIALFVLTFLQANFSEQVSSLVQRLGIDQASVDGVYAIFASFFLSIVTFISYQGLGLIFPGSGKKWFLSLLVGILNGYLYAGSVWYYLDWANWPIGLVVPKYTAFYEFAVQLLPPAIFGWQYFILVAVAMLLLRVVK
jgi:hypothetical protein